MHIREVTIADAKMLFEWRNDETTRKMSVSTEPVEWAAHVHWFENRLQQPFPGLYIVEDEDALGTIRIDGDEISYTVAPLHRGKGIASKMLVLARETFGQKIAKIKRENGPSIAAAQRAGHIVEIIA